ncbi:hypothetical protein [Streptomyces sp. NPDC002403]
MTIAAQNCLQSGAPLNVPALWIFNKSPREKESFMLNEDFAMELLDEGIAPQKHDAAVPVFIVGDEVAYEGK